MATRYTVFDFMKQFPDDNSCLDFLFRKAHGDHSTCPGCQQITKYYRIKKKRSYTCGKCGHQIYPTKGTIFEGSTTPLLGWFYVIFKFLNTRNGVGAMEIKRELGVTYKTAWSMAHKIRQQMAEKDFVLKGTIESVIEMDESQIGGRKNKKKYFIFGMRERGKNGRLKIFVVNDRPKGIELIPIIKKHVKSGSIVYTDKYPGYKDLGKEGYKHKSISHKKTYAIGKVHTNGIEGIWSHIKGSIFGSHRHVSKKWLQRYLDEYTYNYNRKNQPISFDEFFN